MEASGQCAVLLQFSLHCAMQPPPCLSSPYLPTVLFLRYLELTLAACFTCDQLCYQPFCCLTHPEVPTSYCPSPAALSLLPAPCLSPVPASGTGAPPQTRTFPPTMTSPASSRARQPARQHCRRSWVCPSTQISPWWHSLDGWTIRREQTLCCRWECTCLWLGVVAAAAGRARTKHST